MGSAVPLSSWHNCMTQTSVPALGQQKKSELASVKSKRTNSKPTVGGDNFNVSPWALAISIQSLLNQFSHPRVRADFYNGRFECNISPSMLPKLDELRWCLLPRWQGGSLTAATNIRAEDHMQQLLAQTDNLLLTDVNDVAACVSYKEWFKMLNVMLQIAIGREYLQKIGVSMFTERQWRMILFHYGHH